MDTMESRNIIKDKLINYTIIPLSIILTITNIFFITSNNNLKEAIKNNQSKLVNYQKDYKNNTIKLTELETKINDIKNLDTLIETSKKEYYQSLKTLENKVINKEINYKIAYLTFDDGPYHLTHKFLETLEKYNVKATFFTIGLDKEKCYDDRNQSCQELYSKIAKQGHTMANHTYSHSIFYGLYNSSDSFINDVKRQEELIKNKTGITTNIVRFPGGSSSSKNLKNDIINKLRDSGYGWVDWTASNGDGGYIKDTETAMNNFKNTINQDIEVILFHDYSYITLSILPEVIEYLQSQNYILLPLFYESSMVNK